MTNFWKTVKIIDILFIIIIFLYMFNKTQNKQKFPLSNIIRKIEISEKKSFHPPFIFFDAVSLIEIQWEPPYGNATFYII